LKADDFSIGMNLFFKEVSPNCGLVGVHKLLVNVGAEEGGFADSEWKELYVESPRMITLDSFFLDI
jgi:hypothetical protein